MRVMVEHRDFFDLRQKALVNLRNVRPGERPRLRSSLRSRTCKQGNAEGYPGLIFHGSLQFQCRGLSCDRRAPMHGHPLDPFERVFQQVPCADQGKAQVNEFNTSKSMASMTGTGATA